MKRKTAKPKLQPLTATVPPAVRRELDRIAREENRNLSQVVRIALEEFLSRRNAA